MTAIVDKEMLKDALRELLVEDTGTFKKNFKEILSEEKDDNEEFNHFLKANFKRFDATFRALA